MLGKVPEELVEPEVDDEVDPPAGKLAFDVFDFEEVPDEGACLSITSFEGTWTTSGKVPIAIP